MRIRDFERTKLEVRPFLKDYLSKMSRKVDGSQCQCPNGAEHKHDDVHMSCGITDDGCIFHCLTCDAKGDIFSAANYLENKPIVGEEFITENFMYLAKMFGIAYELEEVSDEEKQVQKVYLLYDRVKEIFKQGYALVKEAQEYAKKRKWDKLEDIFEFGACNSYDKVMGIIEKEFDKVTIQKAAITHKDLFLDRLIIPIRDTTGRVCAFGSRSIAEQGRYINSRNNLVYDKSSVLFNFHNARRVSTSIYIVEGFADCITMVKSGIVNTVAINGTSFTLKQYELLVRNRIKKIVMCLDSDDAGKQALEKALTKVIGTRKDLLVFIKEVVDAKDPDEYITKFGVDEFTKLPELSVFEWRLKNYGWAVANSLPQVDTLKSQLLEDVLNEPSYIERDRMAERFAKETQVRLETVQKELHRLEVIKSEKLDITITDIVREETEFERKINDYEEWVFSRKTELLGLPCGFSRFTEVLDGIQNGLYLIGGRPNVGKTSFNLQLAHDLAKRNEKVLVLFWSIDDNLKKVIPRLVAMECGIPINVVSNPMYKVTGEQGYSAEQIREIMTKREDAINSMKSLSNRFIVKDISSGNSVEAIEKSVMVCKTITKTDNLQLVLFIDNFHKLSTEKYMTDVRSKFTYISEQIKRISNVYDAPVITTVELRKSETARPVEEDIKECVTGDTLVEDSKTGRIYRIDELEGKKIYVNGIDKDLKMVEGKVVKWMDKGYKKIYVIRTKTGRVIKGSAKHPILTGRGWIDLKDITEEDVIAIAKKKVSSGNRVHNPDLARLLGYMVGDGHYKSCVFTNQNKDVIDDIVSIARQAFQVSPVTRSHNNSFEVRFSGGMRGKGYKARNRMKECFRSIGIWRDIKADKKVPVFIFNSSNISVANFIGGCFVTDGCVCGKKEIRVMTNCSIELLKGLQTLLLRLGIQSWLRATHKGSAKTLPLWNLSIYGYDNIKLFAEAMPDIPHPKMRKLKRFAKGLSGKGNKYDVLPIQLSEEVNRIRKEQGLSIEAFRKKYSHQVNYGSATYRLTRRVALDLGKKLGCDELIRQANSDVFWDSVVSIEDGGVQKVYDVQVEKYHNFITAEGVVLHNTVDLLYDADCIILLHNEVHRVGELESKIYFQDLDGQKKPILECDICKNKTSAFKGHIFFRFYPDISRVQECSSMEGRKVQGVLNGYGTMEDKEAPPFVT